MLPEASSYRELMDRFRWQIPERYNIGVDVCDKWANLEPGREALVHVERDGAVKKYSFGDLRRLSNQTANLLQAHGIAEGDRVAVLLPQAPETGYAHIAIYKLGGIAIPLFTLFGVEALQYRLANSGAKAIITDREGADKVRQIEETLPELRIVFDIDGGSGDALDFHELLGRQSAEFEPIDSGPDDPALIIYTSGTTGPPKGALHAHRMLLGHLPGVEMSHNFLPQPGDRIWTPADWAWIGGLYDVLMPAWHHGVPVVSHRFAKFDPEAAFQLMADFGVRNSFLPPTALKMMRTVAEPRRRWNYDLRTIASGGETLGSELLDWGQETFGLTINEFYGQTECNMVISNCTDIMPQKPGVMGRCAPGHELRIVDDEGRQVPTGTAGQIAAKKPDPVMFLEYWQNEEATAAKHIGDWLLTGDVAVADEEGYLRFVGRNDDIITSAGYRIGPSEIEDCLLGHPAVRMAAAVGVPDPMRTERVKAYVVLDDAYEAGEGLAAELKEYVKARLSAHEYPREVAFVAELPMTTTGKIMRRSLRAWHEQGIA